MADILNNQKTKKQTYVVNLEREVMEFQMPCVLQYHNKKVYIIFEENDPAL